MSNNDPHSPPSAPPAAPNTTTSSPSAVEKRSIFSIPPPLKRVFDRFPRVVYEENALPIRSPVRRGENVLYVFTTEEDARMGRGRPSFNPGCLKWQTYLKFSGVEFRTSPSNNHASPSGALPFLLSGEEGADPVPSNRLKRWLEKKDTIVKEEEATDLRYEAYASLLDHRVRKAWLYQLYLAPANSSLVHRLYVSPCSSNVFVQMTIAHQLRRAAETELVKASASTTISENDVMRDAGSAFEALSSLLGEDEWFFGLEKPGLFDASVFAYTQLILDETLGWQDNRLAEMLRRYENLVQHQERVLKMYY